MTLQGMPDGHIVRHTSCMVMRNSAHYSMSPTTIVILISRIP